MNTVYYTLFLLDSIDHVDYSNVVEDARPLSFGWPDIQIDVLKDAISVTEALPGMF